MRVTVNNMNEDDAYEAKLVGTFPDTLSYSGVRSHQTTVNKTTPEQKYKCNVTATLGNPRARIPPTNEINCCSTSGAKSKIWPEGGA